MSTPFVETENGVWHEGLQCYIERLEIDLVRKRAVLWLPTNSCTDLRGAVDLVESIDGRIERIYTISGPKRDTCYVRHGSQWVATVFGERDERPIVRRDP